MFIDADPIVKKCRGEKTRTSDLHVPNVARCQLCYTPIGKFAVAKIVFFLHSGNVFVKKCCFWGCVNIF